MERTTCLIAGGGPAGLILGLLLARAGVRVTVLEKHGDFLRDFRGDTVHASTVRLMDELGLGEAFRAIPQSKLGNLGMPAPDGSRIELGDFDALPAPYNYVAMIPQWEFLDFLVAAAGREPTFTMKMNTEVTGVLREDGRVAGVRTRDRDGVMGEIRADLTVGCDGRHSILRRESGLAVREFPVPFDTWWFRLPRFEHERGSAAELLPDFQGKEVLLTFVRPEYYQIAYFTEKGADPRLRAEGVERFRERVARLRPQYADRVDEITSMDDLHLLDVRLNRLAGDWHVAGLLMIGDAAHAMSPAGGMGINLAIQDAVAAATYLAEPLLEGRVNGHDLARVRRRRRFPTHLVQVMQRVLHRLLFAPAFAGKRSGAPKIAIYLARVPGFKRIPARMIAFGPRPEHAPPFALR
ncbi:FAD-dependent oxidoreductase [Nonomuraea sp. B10E15]|uniref:FAD-dependent oxidoreductase n=1 Tax=Nonomuraea sp. B10E15 TaxID=3153560 RepID=UPI00325D2E1B